MKIQSKISLYFGSEWYVGTTDSRAIDRTVIKTHDGRHNDSIVVLLLSLCMYAIVQQHVTRLCTCHTFVRGRAAVELSCS